MIKTGYVYLISNKYNTVLYTGVTSNLVQRIWQHKTGCHPQSFSCRYKLNKLVYFEVIEDIGAAIAREKQIKAGSRKAKERLINKENPTWSDLSRDWYGE